MAAFGRFIVRLIVLAIEAAVSYAATWLTERAFRRLEAGA
jgi:hypothetical protein